MMDGTRINAGLMRVYGGRGRTARRGTDDKYVENGAGRGERAREIGKHPRSPVECGFAGVFVFEVKF